MYRIDVTSSTGKNWVGRLLESGKTHWEQVTTGKAYPTPAEALDYVLRMAHSRGIKRENIGINCPTTEVFSGTSNWESSPIVQLGPFRVTFTNSTHVHIGTDGYSFDFKRNKFYVSMHVYYKECGWEHAEGECYVKRDGKNATNLQEKAVIAEVMRLLVEYVQNNPKIMYDAACHEAWEKACNAEAALLTAERILTELKEAYYRAMKNYKTVTGELPAGVIISVD